MASSNSDDRQLRIAGSPPALCALHDFGSDCPPTFFEIELEGAGGECERLHGRVQPVAKTSLSRVDVTLPADFPPGKHSATIHTDAGDIPVLLNVEGQHLLDLYPPELSFRVPAGRKSTSCELTVVNRGNVRVQVPQVFGFGLYAVDSLEEAFRRTYEAKLDAGDSRADRLIEEMGRNHGGVVRARVKKGFGYLDVGEARKVYLELRFSPRMRPGATYEGSLSFLDQPLRVRIEVEAAKEG